MKHIFTLILSLYSANIFTAQWVDQIIDNKAVIIVPVADVAAKSLAYLAPNVEKVYANLACSALTGPDSCPRAHQLLFNEVVEIVEEKGEEVACILSNVFYQMPDGKKISTFWTLKKYLRPLCDCINLKSIPLAYDADNLDDTTLTLLLPWTYDNTSYSAATRFMRQSELDTPFAYAVQLTTKESDVIAYIPKDIAIIKSPKTDKERRELFIMILYTWLTKLDCIPYIWGGRSCIEAYEDGVFEIENRIQNECEISYWKRPNTDKPYSGFDCSGLVLRAAQMAGLPYYFENTTTLAIYLSPLTPSDTLQNGDLIFMKGHVMVVGDIQSNTVIESRGYGSGYGKIHEIKLKNVFEGIENYNDLLDAYLCQKELRLLKKDLDAERTIINDFKLLKLLN